MNNPNIIFVLVDQMRRDALSCAGDMNVRTPNLDALANAGVCFTAASATFPACVPSRFSILTGHYAHTRNVPALGYRLSPSEHTLGEAMKSAGYNTAYVGKWHLYSAYGVSGGLTLSQASRTPVPATHRRGFDVWRGFELRNDYYDSYVFHDNETTPRKLPGHQTDALFRIAEDCIRDRDLSRPLFLTLSVEAPHPPFVATPEHLARRQALGPLHLRPNTDMHGIGFFPPEWYEADGPAGAVDPADPASVERVFEANMLAYYAMIEQIDDNMGKLVRLLDVEGMRENTIIVFMSDHGELGGSHGQLGKAQPWEESVGIPLIVAGPGITACRTTGLPVCTEDIFPTFVGLAGGAAPDGLPGIDLSGFLRGVCGEPDRDGVLLEFVTETRANRGYYDETWRGIRTRTHKYTVLGNRSGARPWQLFDLEADPYEQRNLLPEDGIESLAADLHGRLSALLDAAEDDYALAPAFGLPGRACVAP